MKEPGSFADKIPEGVELNLWELQEMATRQQEQIESQQQLLVAKEQRLKYLRQQEARHHQMAAEHEKLRKLRERVEQQELKLRKLRALRGQVDNRKISNNVLSTDLETIRALFNEKEKELSVAVAKVDELTRQLEELRRGRLHQKHPPSVTIELEKLRQELMCRTKANEEKSQKISQQKEIMLQKQEEMGKVDKRINELQQRLHRKRILNKQLANQINASRLKFQNDNEKSRSVIHNNIATIEPFKHVDHNLEDPNGTLHDDFIKFRGQSKPLDELSEFISNKNDPKYQTLPYNTKFPNPILKNEDKFNDPASKQYSNHSNSKDNSNPAQITNYSQNQLAVTNNRPSGKNFVNYNANSYNGPNVTYNDVHPTLGTRGQPVGGVTNQEVFENTQSDLAPTYEGQTYPLNSIHYNGQLSVEKPVNTVAPTTAPHRHSAIFQTTSTKIPAVHPHTLSSTPQGILQEVETSSMTRKTQDNVDNPKLPKPALPPKPSTPHKPIIPPRQSHTPPPASNNKNDANREFGLQVNRIRGNGFNYNSRGTPWESNNQGYKGLNRDEEVQSQGDPKDTTRDPQFGEEATQEDGGSENPEDTLSVRSDNVPNVHITINRRIEMPPAFLFPEDETPPLDLLEGGKDVPDASNINLHSSLKILAEFEKLKLDSDLGESGDDLHKEGDIDLYITDDNQNKIEADIEFLNSKNHEHNLESAASHTASIMPNYVQRVKKGNLKGEGSSRPARRVSFDPLALMLDASLEGELELVKKCAKEVANPSAANDEGITALHNAVCAGHFEIVKFLVEFGCDVNIQDSDGWTPLHCAASCNNLAMIKYLVEHGACIFATTLSDHETAAEKCEEDEEGYDGCSEYLYSIQEKLGILNNGVVYALYEYNAQNPDEMSFQNGDAIVVLRKGDEFEREWWWSKHNDQEGYVPRNLLGLYPRYKHLETMKDVS